MVAGRGSAGWKDATAGRHADNTKRIQQERTLRQKAGIQADNLLGKAATMEQQGANADRNYGLGVRRQDAAERHQKVAESQGAERNSISRQRESRLENGGGSNGADFEEYARWKEADSDEVEKIRNDNAQIDIFGRPTKAVTNTIVKLTNAEMRRKYGTARKNSGGSNGNALRNRNGGGSALKNR